MKCVIAGSRDFVGYHYEKFIIDILDENHTDITEVVCGLARGPDMIGGEWAQLRGISVALFPADWDKHGNAAGPIRNGEMADYTDAAVIFWDGKSTGTKNMMLQMDKRKKPWIGYKFELLDEEELKEANQIAFEEMKKEARYGLAGW